MNRYSKLMLAASLSITTGSAIAAESVSVFNDQSQLNHLNRFVGQQSFGAKLSFGDRSKQVAELLATASSGQFKLLNNSNQKQHHLQQQFLRYQQTYQNIPIWDHQVVVMMDKDGVVQQSYGNMVKDIADDLPSFPKLSDSSQQAVLEHFIKSQFSDQPRVFRDKSAQTVIYIDDDQQAHLAHKLSFFTDVKQGNSKPQRIIAFVDVFTKSVISKDNILNHYHDYKGGSGPSGNNKVTRPDYTESGVDDAVPKTFKVKRQHKWDGSKLCSFDADDVKTIDHNHDVTPVSDWYEYVCTDGTFNDDGGYHTAKSALNDAHYHGQLTAAMFEQYLSQKPFKNSDVIQKVHYGRNMDQAFYDNGEVAYGDGEWIFYPMVALDVVAHEIAHGYTAIGSNTAKQMTNGQAGAINESFSDIAGAAAEHFLGTNQDVNYQDDWKSNEESFINPGALRYFDEPTEDGVSIDHIRDYEQNTPIHYAAGLFNKAFHRLVTMPVSDTEQSPWNTKYGFIAFALANKNCWHSTSTFNGAADCIKQQAGEVRNRMSLDGVSKVDGAYWSTSELQNHVRKAFAQVGISINTNQGVESEFSYTSRFLTFDFTSTSRYIGSNITNVADWEWAWDFGDSNVSNKVNPSHSYTAAGKYQVSLSITHKLSGKTDKFSVEVIANSGYCAASGSSLDNYYLASVDINGVKKNSGLSDYSDYSATPIEVFNGGAFDVELVAADSVGGEDGSKNFYMWIDKNDDGLFHKTDELVINQSAIKKVTKTLSVDREKGTTDLRRVRTIVAFTILNDPCGNFSFGEAEDYTLKIVENDAKPEIKVTANLGVNSVDFANNTNDDRIKSWLWEFGDAKTSTKESVVHRYAKSQAYTVNLTGFDSNGTEVAVWSETLNVVNTTEPKISTHINGLAVNFVGANSASPVGSNFLWDFGDGTTSNKIDPDKHTYAQSGVYTVTLTIDNQDFVAGKSITKDIAVSDVVYQPQFTHTVSNDLDVAFNNFSLSPSDLHDEHNQGSLIWDYGDGSIVERVDSYDFGADTSHSYAEAGTYTATLTIEYTNQNGTLMTSEVASETFTLTQGPAPIAYCDALGDVTYEYLQSTTVNGQGPMENVNDGSLTIVNQGNPIVLNAGQDNSFTFVGNFHGAGAYDLNYHVWIDLNGDGLFGDGDWRNDKSELVIAEFAGGTDGTFTGTFSIPTGVNIDKTRMRVMQYWSDFKVNSIDPCSDYTANGEGGEIEDYEVTIN